MSIGNDCGFDDGLWLFAILALLGFGNGFSGMKDCCCDIKSMIMENRYLTERQSNSIINAVHAEGDATRALINANEMARLRDELSVARSENADYRQSQFMLGQMGRWYSNPPCYGPCGNQS